MGQHENDPCGHRRVAARRSGRRARATVAEALRSAGGFQIRAGLDRPVAQPRPRELARRAAGVAAPTRRAAGNARGQCHDGGSAAARHRLFAAVVSEGSRTGHLSRHLYRQDRRRLYDLRGPAQHLRGSAARFCRRGTAVPVRDDATGGVRILPRRRAARRRLRRDGAHRLALHLSLSGWRCYSPPSPSAEAMMRNTRVLSMRPRKASEPGPIAVRITSSAACTPCGAVNGRLPCTRTDCGVQKLSLATACLSFSSAGLKGPDRKGLPLMQ